MRMAWVWEGGGETLRGKEAVLLRFLIVRLRLIRGRVGPVGPDPNRLGL